MYQNSSFNGTSSKESELIRNKENRTFLKYIVNQHQENENHNNEIDKISTIRKYVNEELIEKIIPVNQLKVEKSFCAECGVELSADSKFCPECGTKTESKPKVPTCPKCNAIYEDNVKFCSHDGTKLEIA